MKVNSAWEPVRFEETYDRNASPVVKRVSYEGPHGPAAAEARAELAV